MSLHLTLQLIIQINKKSVFCRSLRLYFRWEQSFKYKHFYNKILNLYKNKLLKLQNKQNNLQTILRLIIKPKFKQVKVNKVMKKNKPSKSLHGSQTVLDNKLHNKEINQLLIKKKSKKSIQKANKQGKSSSNLQNTQDFIFVDGNIYSANTNTQRNVYDNFLKKVKKQKIIERKSFLQRSQLCQNSRKKQGESKKCSKTKFNKLSPEQIVERLTLNQKKQMYYKLEKQLNQNINHLQQRQSNQSNQQEHATSMKEFQVLSNRSRTEKDKNIKQKFSHIQQKIQSLKVQLLFKWESQIDKFTEKYSQGELSSKQKQNKMSMIQKIKDHKLKILQCTKSLLQKILRQETCQILGDNKKPNRIQSILQSLHSFPSLQQIQPIQQQIHTIKPRQKQITNSIQQRQTFQSNRLENGFYHNQQYVNKQQQFVIHQLEQKQYQAQFSQPKIPNQKLAFKLDLRLDQVVFGQDQYPQSQNDYNSLINTDNSSINTQNLSINQHNPSINLYNLLTHPQTQIINIENYLQYQNEEINIPIIKLHQYQSQEIKQKQHIQLQENAQQKIVVSEISQCLAKKVQLSLANEINSQASMSNIKTYQQSNDLRSSHQSSEQNSENIQAQQSTQTLSPFTCYQPPSSAPRYSIPLIMTKDKMQSLSVQYQKNKVFKQNLQKHIGVQLSCIQDQDLEGRFTTLLAINNWIVGFYQFMMSKYTNTLVDNLNISYGKSVVDKIFCIRTEGIILEQIHNPMSNIMTQPNFLQYQKQLSEMGQSCSQYESIHNFAVFHAFTCSINIYRPYYQLQGQVYPWIISQKGITFYQISQDNLEEVFQKSKMKIIQVCSALAGVISPMDQRNQDQRALIQAKREDVLQRTVKTQFEATYFQWDVSIVNYQCLVRFNIFQFIYQQEIHNCAKQILLINQQ